MNDQDRIPPDSRDRSEALDLAKQARSQFLASMSHELRTPIHGILSFAEFGLREIESAPRSDLGQYFQQIHESGNVLLGLLNDLLDLARLEARRMVFNMAPVDLASLTLDFVSEFQIRVQERRLSMEVVDPEGDTTVEGDAQRLAQALRHLLANTLRHARTRVAVKLEQEADGAVTISIRDDRPRIAPVELEQLFDPMAQTQRTGGHTIELGMPIAREIVTAHGGTISIETDDDGTVFLVRLPRQRAGRGDATLPRAQAA